MDGRIQYPTGFCWDNIIAYGTTGVICLDEASQTVVKFPHRDEDKPSTDVERRIYEQFQEHGGHKNIVRYHGLHEHSIRLEYVPSFNFEAHLSTHKVDSEQKLQWAQQIIDALCFVHSMHVIHGDLNIYNILLDENLNAKLADFAGSSLEGSPLLVGVTASYRSPGDTLCIQGDIFAFGSTLYKIITGYNPYHDLTEREIKALFLKGSFPETNSLGPLGEVISKCWRGKYKNTHSVCKEIKGTHGFLI
ncbi:kinase-like protein [Mytilinidion resinicola]|uniref:Kinase-like protein n=1 Tax=Mytilinidion resinicola TaxID=574789 RepID=A0A6A6YYQ8_9PEZI|nr:kinase-like protein [Mytilinidion resinicola]KAF2813573.1 kinase-like protein [Mytilinidion resinicola]